MIQYDFEFIILADSHVLTKKELLSKNEDDKAAESEGDSSSGKHKKKSKKKKDKHKHKHSDHEGGRSPSLWLVVSKRNSP